MKNPIRVSMLLAITLGGMAVQELNAGAILRLYYDGVPGNSVADLRSSALFPNAPTFYDVLTEALEGLENEPDDYGSWIRGYLEAPLSGDYVFWIASDDDSELWLSTDHTVDNLRKIAENIGAVGDRAFDAKPTQRSEPVALERGGKYYLEVFHKEGAGAAHIAVGWELPDGTVQRPLPGDHLLIFPIQANWQQPQPRQTAPVILTDYFFLPVPLLLDTTAEEGQPAVFRVTVDATQPAAFQWLRNDVEMPGAILSFLRLESVVAADHGARYSVRISNGLGSVTSPSVALSVQPDFERPTLVSASTRGNPNGLDVRFSEPVDEVTATNPANYQIAPGVMVSGATLLDGATVRLETSSIAEGSVYSLSVNNVKDRAAAGNSIAANSQITFLQVQGVITEKEFKDIPGPLLADLTGNSKFPGHPDAVTFRTAFETTPLRRDNYGVQFQGFLIPPVTGEYVFYVSSRNQSTLFLSPDDDPSKMVQIARETEFSAPRDWETPRLDGANISTPQLLEAGHKYYIEGRMKAAARLGADFVDHFAVTWQRPGDASPVNGDPPIPAGFLSPLATLGPVAITTAPANATTTELEPVAFSVVVDGTPPYVFQWLKNGQPIAGAIEPTLIIREANLADNGAAISVQIMNAFSEITSPSAVLTVNPDTTAPAIVDVVARNIPTIVNVEFTETIDPFEAEMASNYTVAPGITVSAAALQPDGRTVTLTTSSLSAGTQYTLTVNNIRDRASQPNTLAPDSARTFTFVGTARVTRGLQALYTFREGNGTLINDASGVGTPLNLEIREPDKVTWLSGGGLSLNSETRVVSFDPAAKINEAAMAANQLTVEVWVKPANVEQQGPARIVTVSAGPTSGDRNFSLNLGQAGQPAEQRSCWTARGATGSGMPDYFSTEIGTATTNLQHVVYTHNPINGDARIYVDGVELASGQYTGNFSQWGIDRGLVLGNENTLVGSGRFWLGELHLVAVYAATLSSEEVRQNFDVGLEAAPPPPLELAVSRTGTHVLISWTGAGTLEAADSMTGTWSLATSQANPQTVIPTGAAMFFRLRHFD
jgi:hypothetical protein